MWEVVTVYKPFLHDVPIGQSTLNGSHSSLLFNENLRKVYRATLVYCIYTTHTARLYDIKGEETNPEKYQQGGQVRDNKTAINALRWWKNGGGEGEARI